MRILLISLLIACAASENLYKISYINYNTEYIVDVSQFPEG